MKHISLILAVAATVLAAPSCKTQQDSTEAGGTVPAAKIQAPMRGGGAASVAMLAPVIIYKTHSDYRNLVPVALSADGSRIASYPAPGDVGRGGKYSTPVELSGGYLWDRRGVSAHTAFTDYTYEQYAALPSAPTADELMRHVKYRNPFTEMYAVEGLRNPTREQLDSIVENGFTGCRAIIKNGQKTK